MIAIRQQVNKAGNMPYPIFLRQWLAHARPVLERWKSARQAESLRAAAYVATLFIPLMLIISRGTADALGALIGLSFLYRSYQWNDWQWTRDPVVRIGFAAWLWMVLVVSPFAADGFASFSIALPWVRFLLLYAALRYWVLIGKIEIEYLAIALAIMLALVMVDTLWQFFSGISLTGHLITDAGRLSGPMSSVKVGIFIAKLLLPVAGLCFYFSFEQQKKPAIIASSAFLFSAVVIILFSGERTALIGALVGVMLAGGLVTLYQPRLRLPFLISIALFLAIGVLMLATQRWTSDRAVEMMQTLANFRTSNYGQLFWAGGELGREHWLTGTGFKGFRELCGQFVLSGQIKHCNLHPHNLYVEWFAETGAMGFILLLGIIGALIREAVRHLRAARGIGIFIPAMALGTCAVHFFPLLATQSFFSNWPAILLWYSLGLAYAGFNLKDEA